MSAPAGGAATPQSSNGSPAPVPRPRRRLVVARDLGELWLARIEDDAVGELVVRPESGARWLGAIAKGRISRLAPGVRAAFVDIGLGRDIFTVMPPGTIAERHLAPGDEVLVQVTREAQGGKGHRATFELTLPGWGLVLSPDAAYRGVSRRIEDEAERERLRAILQRIAPPEVGLIARTAATGATEDELRSEAEGLAARWAEIRRRADGMRAPAIVHREENPALVFVRDHLADPPDEIVVEGEGLDEIAALAAHLAAENAPLVKAHPGPLPAVEAYRLEAALERALSTDVPLPGGGRLVIQTTEALTAIDVNSGRDTSGSDLEDTALRTNLEAAAEVVRQIRLRDLGGLIVVDFIDMHAAAARARLNDAMSAAFADDREKARVLPLTDFCLVQITRQRKRMPLEKVLLEPCSCCGRGQQARPEFEARRLLREARRRSRAYPNPRVRVVARAAVLEAAREIAGRWGVESGFRSSVRFDWREGARALEVDPN